MGTPHVGVSCKLSLSSFSSRGASPAVLSSAGPCPTPVILQSPDLNSDGKGKPCPPAPHGASLRFAGCWLQLLWKIPILST